MIVKKRGFLCFMLALSVCLYAADLENETENENSQARQREEFTSVFRTSDTLINANVVSRQRYLNMGFFVSSPSYMGGSAASVAGFGFGRINEKNFFAGAEFYGLPRSAGAGLNLGQRIQSHDWFQMIVGGHLGFLWHVSEDYYKYTSDRFGRRYGYITNDIYFNLGTGPFSKFLFGKGKNWGEVSQKLLIGFGGDIDYEGGRSVLYQTSLAYTRLIMKRRLELR